MPVSVPAMILRRLYVKKSLKNTTRGAEFVLKNILADATIVKPVEIAVDDKSLPLDKIVLISEGKEVKSSEISESNPLDFSLNTSITIVLEGVQLERGQHKIVISTNTREYGAVKFDITDSIA